MNNHSTLDIKDPYASVPENETLKAFVLRTKPYVDFDHLHQLQLEGFEMEKKLEKGIIELAKTKPMLFWEGDQGYIRYPDGKIVRSDR